MVHHSPRAIDTSEPVCGGKRISAISDKFKANHSALIIENHSHGIVSLNALLVRIAQNISVRLKYGRTANESWPSRMHTGDVLVGPDTAHLLEIAAREGFVVCGIGGENVVLFAQRVKLPSVRGSTLAG